MGNRNGGHFDRKCIRLALLSCHTLDVVRPVTLCGLRTLVELSASPFLHFLMKFMNGMHSFTSVDHLALTMIICTIVCVHLQ